MNEKDLDNKLTLN